MFDDVLFFTSLPLSSRESSSNPRLSIAGGQFSLFIKQRFHLNLNGSAYFKISKKSSQLPSLLYGLDLVTFQKFPFLSLELIHTLKILEFFATVHFAIKTGCKVNELKSVIKGCYLTELLSLLGHDQNTNYDHGSLQKNYDEAYLTMSGMPKRNIRPYYTNYSTFNCTLSKALQFNIKMPREN